MDRRDRFPRAGASKHTHGPVPFLFHDLSLGGMKENSPSFQRGLEDRLKLQVVLGDEKSAPCLVGLECFYKIFRVHLCIRFLQFEILKYFIRGKPEIQQGEGVPRLPGEAFHQPVKLLFGPESLDGRDHLLGNAHPEQVFLLDVFEQERNFFLCPVSLKNRFLNLENLEAPGLGMY
ncbi:hypothetical protein SDC9_114897 [bioreactor metagenome]|uniref:Uncharacterized protein n=1 Tax=bioreactor metagenome TaxID=1076179 RepID=A0A645BTM1_9ZZZZ